MPMYDKKKVAQAAAVLFRAEGAKNMHYLRLIKLLYIADREALAETGRTISGDRMVAMKHGPVLSETYNHIRERLPDSNTWQYYIRTGWCSTSSLTHDPGDDELSEYEKKKLVDVSRRYRGVSRWKLRDLTHEFPEWKKNDPGNSSRPIPVADILEAVGRGDDADEIIGAIEADARISQLLAGLPNECRGNVLLQR